MALHPSFPESPYAILDPAVRMVPGGRSTQGIKLRYDVLYGKVKAFVQTELFDRPVDLESPNALRNLSELAATKTLLETFKRAINALTVQDTRASRKEFRGFGGLPRQKREFLAGSRSRPARGAWIET